MLHFSQVGLHLEFCLPFIGFAFIMELQATLFRYDNRSLVILGRVETYHCFENLPSI